MTASTVTHPDYTGGMVDPRVLRAELLEIIGTAVDDHPRSKQVRLGPSEIGEPCDRKLGLKLLGAPERPQAPAWKAQVGTSVHEFLQDVLDAWNVSNGYIDEPRWLVEERVSVGTILDEEITGSCDVYDNATHTVIDWKIPGQNTMRKVGRGYINPAYAVQRQAYGRGWARRGYPVHMVACMYLPKDGELDDAVFDAVPYDESVVIEALTRVERIKTIVAGFPAAVAALPRYDSYCRGCPYLDVRPGADPLTTCPGHRG